MGVRSMALLCVLLALGFAASGCGDGGDDSDSIGVTTSSLTKEQYLEQADEACAQVRSDLLDERLESPAGDQAPSQAEQASAYYAALGSEVDAVEALGSPRGDEKRVEVILVAKQEAIDAAADAVGLSQDEIEALFREANREMRDYGMEVCLVGNAL